MLVKDPKVSSTWACWGGGTKSTFTVSRVFFPRRKSNVGSLARLSVAEAQDKKSTSAKVTGQFSSPFLIARDTVGV